jgi:hypothetical protein
MNTEQKEKWKMKEQPIHLSTGLIPDWSTVPWQRNGVIALTSGISNSTPDPTAHTLATKTINKAILSAHHGISTILLLEVQGKLILFPDARAETHPNV